MHQVGEFTGHSVTARPKPQKLKSLTCVLDEGPVAVEERVSLDCIKGEAEAHRLIRISSNCVYTYAASSKCTEVVEKLI